MVAGEVVLEFIAVHEPVTTGGDHLEVINEIGSFITLDVPGPRVSRLRAQLRLPGFALGREAAGTLEVHNVGSPAVRFWGENDATSWPGGGTPRQQRFDKSLVPKGRMRSLRVVAKPDWWVGFVTVKVQIIYPSTTEASTKQIALRKRVLVVDPWALVVLGAVLVGVVVECLRRRRRLAARARRRGPSVPPRRAAQRRRPASRRAV